jgi:hypothetical protein
MSKRNEADVRTIHERAIATLGMEACIVALGVARDLRSGAIPREHYDQGSLVPAFSNCGTACCIAGHIAARMRVSAGSIFGDDPYGLFAGGHPSNPKRAANAIERFIYDGSERPWEP